MIKVRLHGTPDEISKFTEWLQKQPRVRLLSVSENYSDRGKSLSQRCYMDVEMLSDAQMLEGLNEDKQ